MKTIRLEEPGRLVLTSTDPPAAPNSGEVLVRVRRIGVCGTDIHAFHGDQPFFSYPRILGHELGVEVMQMGDSGGGLKTGDLCSVEPYINCCSCIACRRDKPNCCVSLQTLGVHIDGGMREEIVVPRRKLHVSRALTLDQLALVETLGIGCHAVERAGVESGEIALIIGAGPIGLAVTQFVINATGQSALEALKAATGGDLPTVVFDATGNANSMMDAFDFTAQGGRLVFVGLVQGDVTFSDPNFHRRELTLLSSRNARPYNFTHIILAIESGRIDTTPWITHRAQFAEAVAEFPKWTRPETGVIKAMIEV